MAELPGDRELAQHIERLPHARATFKQLVRELGAKGQSREQLEAALERLAARGEVIETRSGHYVSTRNNREFAAGRLSMHRDGYGFVIPDYPIEGLKGDIFVPPEAAGSA